MMWRGIQIFFLVLALGVGGLAALTVLEVLTYDLPVTADLRRG